MATKTAIAVIIFVFTFMTNAIVTTSYSMAITTPTENCGDPPTISGGKTITKGPYGNGNIAVFACTSGYIMVGDAYSTCSNGNWSSSPTCVSQDKNTINVHLNQYEDAHLPSWLIYFMAVLFGILAPLLLTCLVAWCCQLLGYMSSPCCCKVYPSYNVYDENGRCNHYDCYGRPDKEHTKTKINAGRNIVMSETHSEASTQRQMVTAMHGAVIEKKIQPAKEIQAWLPHTNSVRNINTSTK